MHADPTTVAPRGRLTWTIFAVAGCFAYLLTGIGSILTPLQEELGVSRGQVALLPALFAVGLVIVGLVGGPAVHRIGRQTAVRAAMVGVAIGAVLVTGPGWPVALVGAAILGASCAVLIQLLPVIMGALHPRRTTALIAEQNAVSSMAAVLAPLAVGAALALGAGWRFGYLVPAVLSLLLVPAVRGVAPAPPERHATRSGGHPRSLDRPFWARWLDILIAVSAEFCVLFWITSAFTSWYVLSTEMAVVWGSTFLVGMATVRSLGTPITRLIADRSMIVTVGCAVAMCGFLLFWAGGSVPLSALGAVILGLGIGLLYPVTITALMRARPGDPDGASARGALASGLAIGIAPLLLATASDQVGLHTAYLVVPLLLGSLLARSILSRRHGRRQAASARRPRPTD